MDPLLIRLQRALTGRYSVEHELGRGGMAVVYLGQDLRLERRVAIKVFEKEGGLISAGERFLREIRIAAQLQHPNILPVHDSGEGEGLVYYVMPYVAGGSVRERLEREGPLPMADAVRIAREVAEALDHAHRAGIVHRDIKPDNIMLADGVAVVADFGIARAIEQGSSTVTDTGLAIGTPTYMSPEQASASPQIDGRTDIYALGCVLYEMLAGAPPFSGTTAQMVMARHATDAAPPLSTVRSVPPALEAAIQKALAKLPGDRWPTGRAFAEALVTSGTMPAAVQPAGRTVRPVAWIAGAAILVVAAVLILQWPGTQARQAGAARESDSLPSIAVLPFLLLGDSAQAHIASGLTEAVITAFVRVGGLRVPGQSTVSRYEGRGRDPVVAGRELQVQNVLTASVQIAGPTLRVTPRMIRVADGLVLWSMTLNGSMSDVFAMQDQITQQILDTLRVRLTPASRAVLVRGVGTRDQDAYNLYMLGRSHYLRHHPASLRRAVDYFKQAAARDSGYAAPLVGLLDVYELLENVEPGKYQLAGPGPEELLRRALALDSTNGDALLHDASRRWRACDTAGAERTWQAALRFSPGSALLRRDYASTLLSQGRSQEALALTREAAAIEPTSPWVLVLLAVTYTRLGQHDSALAVSERALTLDSTQWVPNAVRGVVEAHAGRLEAGIAHMEAARRLGGDGHGLSTGNLGWAYGRAGRREDALRIARLLAERVGAGEATRVHVAFVYAGLGDRETAFQWLAKPPQSTDWKAPDNFWDPKLDSLRSDPRFAPLAARRWCAPGA